MMSDVSVPITQITEYFSEDYLKKVLRRVQKYYPQASEEFKSAHHVLDNFLSFNREERRAIKKALKGVVKPWPDAFLSSFRKSSKVATAVLETWVNSHLELDSTVRQALDAAEIPVEESYGRIHGYVGSFSTEILEAIRHFEDAHSEYSADDVRLMFSCLTAHLPLSKPSDITGIEPTQDDEVEELVEPEISAVAEFQEIYEEENGHYSDALVLSPRWQTLLNEIQKIPPDSDDWDTASLFAQTLNQLIDSKLEERTNSSERLKQVIADLRSQFSEELDAFGSDIPASALSQQWNTDLCPIGETSQMVVTLERLRDAFAEFHEVHQKQANRGTRPAERRALRDQAEELQNEIETLYKTVAAKLSAPDALSPIIAAEKLPTETLPILPAPARLKTETGPKPELSTKPEAAPQPELAHKAERQPDPEPHPEPEHQPEPEPQPLAQELEPLPDHSVFTFPPELSSAEIATQLLSSDSENQSVHGRDLIWRLLYEGNPHVALALSQLLESSQMQVSAWIPSWVLKALVLGSQVLTANERMETILSDCFKHFDATNFFVEGQKEWNQASRLLIAAAAIRPALVAPLTGAGTALLQLQFTRLPHLYKYCQYVGAFSEKRQVLDVSALKGVKEFVSWKHGVDKLQAEAAKWWKAADGFRIDYPVVLRVWQHWLHKGLVNDLMQPIMGNVAEQLPRIEKLLKQFSNDREIRKAIENTDRVKLPRRKQEFPIDQQNKELGNVVNHTKEALGFAERWVELQRARPRDPKNYLQASAEELGDSLLKFRPEINNELDAFENHTSSILFRAAINQLRHALNNVWALVDPQFPLPAEEPDPDVILNAGFLRIPSVELDNEWNVATDRTSALRAVLSAIGTSDLEWETAFDKQQLAGNHRATLRIIDYLRTSGELDPSSALAKLETERDNNLHEWQETLKQRALDEIRSVDRAGVNDWLTQEETDNHLKRIRSVLDSLEDTLEFTDPFQQLDLIEQDVQDHLATERKRANARLNKLTLQKDDERSLRVQRAIANNDFRTANEYVDLLNEGLHLPDEDEYFDYLREFFPGVVNKYTKLDKMSRAQLPDRIRSRQNVCGVSLDDTTVEEAARSAGIIELWRRITSQESATPDEIAEILRYLGFGEPRVTAGDRTDKLRWFTAVTQTLRSQQLCSVPQYGSRALGRYDVLCVFDTPVEDELIKDVKETAYRAVIVFYFGALDEAERREIARLCRENKTPQTFIVLDDALLLYLSKINSGRMGVLFDCSLPFTWLQPYTSTGLVPFETFYGRANEKAQIKDPKGPCFVYGGKRLGKTALLYEVRDEFHAPQENRIAVLIDLKGTEAGVNADHIWRLISEFLGGKTADTEDLKELRIFPPTMAGNASPETLLDHIYNWLADPSRRVLLMLDEADDFLDSDGEERTKTGDEAEFVRVHKLMKLWEKTDGRFKVVFAGLHNVLRTVKVAGKVNPSISHLGEPDDAICVGPLLGKDRIEAIRLIRRPLHTLGYRFESQDLVLRILSHTNWYPGLIQTYCEHLLKHLQHLHDSRRSPPYVISSKQVEDAYSKVLYKQLKSRFEYTLDLDTRYKVIANSIAHLLLSEEGDAARSLTVEEIQREALSWWSEGFRQTASVTEESFRALLDEMEGLGVVRHDESGRYTLRSVNIFSILGKKNEIINVLKGPHKLPTKCELVTHRSPFPDHATTVERKWQRSPLTAQQIADLQSNRNGASLIFGSQASGLDYLKDFLFLAFGEKGFIQIHSALDTDSFVRELRTHLAKRPSEGVTLICIDSLIPWTHEWVDEALKHVQALTSPRSWARTAFIADPRKTWSLLNNSTTELFAKKGLTPFSLTPWHDAAVTQWIEDCFEVRPKDDHREWIKEVSGNWPIVLRELYDAGISAADLESSLAQFCQLEESLDYARKVWSSFGLDITDPVEVLKTLELIDEPLDKEGLSVLMNISPTDIARSLRWAELLMLVMPSGKGLWQIDPVVARTLKLIRTASQAEKQ